MKPLSFLKAKKNNTEYDNKDYYLIDEDNGQFSVNEAYKTARTNIMFTLNHFAGCKTIVITSAWPGEGKTTSSINLAITLAKANLKTLLIDADLRKPLIARIFNQKKNEGLTSFIGGYATLDKVISKTKFENLDIIFSGPKHPFPAELFELKTTGDLFMKLTEMYDYIIIDTPPINVVTDAAVLSKYTNGVILVVKHLNTDHRSIKEAISRLRLAKANMLGFLLNNVDYDNYRYKYKHNYYYKYGYSKKYYNYYS